MKIKIDNDTFERPFPCTPRIILVMAKKSPEAHQLFAQCFPGDDRLLDDLDLECEWASTFFTFPKVVNNG